jgi:hypothetical protein
LGAIYDLSPVGSFRAESVTALVGLSTMELATCKYNPNFDNLRYTTYLTYFAIQEEGWSATFGVHLSVAARHKLSQCEIRQPLAEFRLL